MNVYVLSGRNSEMEGELSLARKSKRLKKGKGRKERMKHKIEQLTIENEEHQRKSKELSSKNLELRRLVLIILYY